MNERHDRACRAEKLLEGRQSFQQSLPGRFSRVELQLVRDLIRCGHASAGDAVVELQYPNPTARKDVMHGSLLLWIWCGLFVAEKILRQRTYILKMGKQCLRPRK